MAENLNKHQQMARTGKFEHFDKGGAVKGHGEHGHQHMHEHHEGLGKHKGSIHHVTSETGESVSSWDTESIGTDGGGKHEHGGGTGGTRNPV